jgi:hypothetical protein
MKNPSKPRHIHIVIANRLEREELTREQMLALKFDGAPRRREAVDLISAPAPRTPQPAALTHNPFALALSGFGE